MFTLNTFFSDFGPIYGGLEVRVLDWVSRMGFSVDGIWACCMVPTGFFWGWGVLGRASCRVRV